MNSDSIRQISLSIKTLLMSLKTCKKLAIFKQEMIIRSTKRSLPILESLLEISGFTIFVIFLVNKVMAPILRNRMHTNSIVSSLDRTSRCPGSIIFPNFNFWRKP